MILVTGATGNAGGAVVRACAAADQRTRALVQDSRAVLPSGVEAVPGDLNQPDTLRPALADVSAIFLLSGYEELETTLAEARAAGVERIVLLSSSAAPGGDVTNAIARYHIMSEQAVRDSGMAWTFLQPNSFMSNALRRVPQIQAGDVVRRPFPGVRVASVHPDDIGAVALEALTSSAHDGRSDRLSGPESLLPADEVGVLAAGLGRILRFEGQSDAEARAEMSERMPDEYVEAFMSFFAEGTLDESEVRPTVQQITANGHARSSNGSPNTSTPSGRSEFVNFLSVASVAIVAPDPVESR